MSQGPILELDRISHRLGKTTILHDVSWALQPGEHWGVLGANGCGKTTLLRIATGYLWPNAGGEVRRCGISRGDIRQMRLGIGWISSSVIPQIPPEEIVLDTVVSGRLAQLGLKLFLGTAPTRQDYEDARTCLNQLDGSALERRAFGTLSQGEQQLVLLGRAQMAEPHLLVLDEPCAGLDPGARERFLTSLSGLLRSAPRTPSVIMVTHHIEELIPEIQHVLALHQGQVVDCGSKSAVVNADLIRKLYRVPLDRLEQVGNRYFAVWGNAHAQRGPTDETNGETH